MKHEELYDFLYKTPERTEQNKINFLKDMEILEKYSSVQDFYYEIGGFSVIGFSVPEYNYRNPKTGNIINIFEMDVSISLTKEGDVFYYKVLMNSEEDCIDEYFHPNIDYDGIPCFDEYTIHLQNSIQNKDILSFINYIVQFIRNPTLEDGYISPDELDSDYIRCYECDSWYVDGDSCCEDC